MQGRAARTARDLDAAFLVHRRVQQAGAALDDARQLLGGVELQPRHDAKAVAQRLVSMPARVVAPTRVKGCRSSLMLRAAGPSPIMMSIW